MAQSAEMGAIPTLRAATDPGVRNGEYYGPGGMGQQRGYPKRVESNKYSYDREVQMRLWKVSEEATNVRTEEHTSELQSLMRISYAVFCLKKKKTKNITH